MANEKHVALLESGVENWNKWREENPDEKPDLEGADLGGANLKDVNLEDANLDGAKLTRSIGFSAIFSQATGKSVLASERRGPGLGPAGVVGHTQIVEDQADVAGKALNRSGDGITGL